jgi:hypothetical protein
MIKEGFVVMTASIILGLSWAQIGAPANAEAFLMTPPLKPFEPQIIGPGTKQSDPAAWPATFVFRNKSNGACTATVIGEQVVLTAAHCISDGDVGSLKPDPQTTVKLTCNQHPNYIKGDKSADFALCRGDI